MPSNAYSGTATVPLWHMELHNKLWSSGTVHAWYPHAVTEGSFLRVVCFVLQDGRLSLDELQAVLLAASKEFPHLAQHTLKGANDKWVDQARLLQQNP